MTQILLIVNAVFNFFKACSCTLLVIYRHLLGLPKINKLGYASNLYIIPVIPIQLRIT